MERVLIEVRGTVHGVGFRPHVYSLAISLGLSGFAQNRGAHLFICLEGDSAALRTFVEALSATPPARAVIDAFACSPARLARCAETLLEQRGLAPLVHRMVPCNDGGLALKQAVAAALSPRVQAPNRKHSSCA